MLKYINFVIWLENWFTKYDKLINPREKLNGF